MRSKCHTTQTVSLQVGFPDGDDDLWHNNLEKAEAPGFARRPSRDYSRIRIRTYVPSSDLPVVVFA